MKVPINCPICNEVLVSTFIGQNNRELRKKCDTQISHSLTYTSNQYDYDIVVVLTLSTPTGVITWEPELSEKMGEVTDYTINAALRVLPANTHITIEMAYFEPDFSNLPKLLQKIKNYLTFV